ncbi:metal-response element-binding transcription factor 2-like isoform X2 [Amphiura filiformis]|uniref:metal-response element-binding transcription factor 2-like isoform X2 n=1 Tax=Amphiura filiformis TaxID=82378 RepID=UPI003B21F753
MDKGSSPKKSPPQLSPPPIFSPYSPNNNNSPPDICSDGPHLVKHDNGVQDSPPRLRREVQASPPKLSPKDGKESMSSEQEEKEGDEMFSSPTPSTSSKKSGSPCQFTIELDVLARWSDGLVYLGTILKVDEDLHRCFVVRFEDNSEHWVLFKDLQKGRTHKKNSEITCVMCESGLSESPDEIVICDKCELGYHQLCHRPNIDSRILLTPDEPWFCRQCVFANSTKIGGALKRGATARAFQEVKKNLPYKLESIHWDTAHKTNKERCYCYCGGPGDWYLKMLQCCRCKQWFHEACVQCLDIPMMYGDRFYIFVCSVCNDGPEYLKKLPLKWVDLAHLLLYNLTLLHTKKYYDLDAEIMPFLMEHWNNLQIAELGGTTRLDKQEHMLTALNSTKMKFVCGREVKKKIALWGLRVRNSPVPPTVVLPAVGQITDEIMEDLQMKGRKVVTFVPVPSTSPVPLISRKKGKKRTLSESGEEEDKSKKKLERKEKKERKKLEKAISSGQVGKPYSANQSYKGYRGTDNFANLLNLSPVKKGQSVLDSIQPLESTFKCGGRGICKHKLEDELKAAAMGRPCNRSSEGKPILQKKVV